MKKLNLFFISLMLLLSVKVFSQVTTMTLGPASISGDTVIISINVSNFNNVGAISLKISYDTTALKFTGISNAPVGVSFVRNAIGGAVMLGWFDGTANSPISINGGKLIDLIFIGKGNLSKFSFDSPACEISDEKGKVIPVSFINGN